MADEVVQVHLQRHVRSEGHWDLQRWRNYVGATESVVAIAGDGLNPPVDTRSVAQLRVELAVANTSLPLHLPLRLRWQSVRDPAYTMSRNLPHHLSLHDLIVNDTSVVEFSGLDLVDGLLLGQSDSGQEAQGGAQDGH